MKTKETFRGLGSITTYLETDFDLLKETAHKAGIAALGKMGAYIWRAAKWSIRTRPNHQPSPPGKPYAAGTGFLKESIVFNVNKTRGIVSIGSYRGGNVDEIHEFGLSVTRFVSHRNKLVKYPKRPVMVPALEKAEKGMQRKFPREFERFFKTPGRATIGG